jgi:hypothetical protein
MDKSVTLADLRLGEVYVHNEDWVDVYASTIDGVNFYIVEQSAQEGLVDLTMKLEDIGNLYKSFNFKRLNRFMLIRYNYLKLNAQPIYS